MALEKKSGEIPLFFFLSLTLLCVQTHTLAGGREKTKIQNFRLVDKLNKERKCLRPFLRSVVSQIPPALNSYEEILRREQWRFK